MASFFKFAVKTLLAQSGLKLSRVPAPVERWPNKSDDAVAVKTILIFTPPNSGSTAMSKFLTASKYVSSFYGVNNEMQWLIPGLAEQDRWWPEKPVSYRSIAGTLNVAAKRALQDKPDTAYFVEKSPPNMVRHRDLLALFETPMILVNNRNPYANIASQIGRYGETHYKGLDRRETLRHLAEIWIYRSQYLAEIAETYDAPILTYEGFCEAPQGIQTCLNIDLDDLHESIKVDVKDYSAQGITNMNAEQIAMLSDEDIDIITSVVLTRPDLLDLFSYSVI